MEPGVIVELQAAELLRLKVGSLHDGLGHAVEHESAQLLDASFRPEEQVEATLEQLLLRDVARGGVTVLVGLAGEKECFKLRVEPLALRKTCFTEWHGERGGHANCGTYHGGVAPSPP